MDTRVLSKVDQDKISEAQNDQMGFKDILEPSSSLQESTPSREPIYVSSVMLVCEMLLYMESKYEDPYFPSEGLLAL